MTVAAAQAALEAAEQQAALALETFTTTPSELNGLAQLNAVREVRTARQALADARRDAALDSLIRGTTR